MAKAPESPMSLYESIFIIRQDVSSADVDKIAEDFEKLVKDYKGEVVKKEYWGLRNLAYEIDNNSKGHYFFFGLRAENDLLAELDRKIKLSESIIRSSIVRVESISKEPSDILKEDDESISEDVVELQQNNARPARTRTRQESTDNKSDSSESKS